MKNKSWIFSLLLAVIVLPCVILLSACGCSKEPKVMDIEIYINCTLATDTNKTISYTYGEIKLQEDITIYAKYDNNSTKPISSGYSFSIKNSELEVVELTKNLSIGSYTITVTYGDYNKELNLEIHKASFDMINVDWNYSSPFTYDGNTKTVKLTNVPAEVTAVYSGNTGIDANSYTASVQFSYDTANYKLINNSVTDLNWSIAKADPIYEVPTNLTASVGDLLSSVDLPTGFSWNNPSNAVGEEGLRTHIATFTPNNADNYNTLSNISITITVEKTTPIYTQPSQMTATYTNTLSMLTSQFPVVSTTSSETPGSWAFVSPSTSVGNVGTRTFQAIFTPDDLTTYRMVTVNVSVVVSPMPVMKPTLAGTYTYNGNSQTASINNFSSSIMNVDGNNQTNANTTGYIITIGLKDKTNYVWNGSNSNDINLNWIIGKATRSFTGLVDISKTYDGYTAYPNIQMTFGDGTYSIQYAKQSAPTEYKTQQYIAVGNYKYKVSVEESSNFKAFSYERDFTISKFTGNEINSLTITGWTYLDTPNTPSATATFGGLYYSYSTTENGEYHSSPVFTAGTWWVKAYVIDTINYNGCLRKTSFVIAQKPLASPTISGSFTYNETNQTAVLDGYYNAYMSVANNTRTDAGTQNIQVTITDSNYKWTTTDNATISVEWTISKAGLATQPDNLSAYSDQTLGDIKSNLPALAGAWSWVLGDSTNVGTAGQNVFQAVFTPTDTTNYKTQTFNVEVNVTTATIDIVVKENSASTYKLGSTYSTGDVVITVTKNYGSPQEVNVTLSMMTNFSTATVGTGITAIITYQGAVCNYTYTVVEGDYKVTLQNINGVTLASEYVNYEYWVDEDEPIVADYSYDTAVEGKILSHYRTEGNSDPYTFGNTISSDLVLRAIWTTDSNCEYSVSGDGTYAILSNGTNATGTVNVSTRYHGLLVKEIGNNAFNNNTNVNSVLYYSSDSLQNLEVIGDSAFEGCSSFGLIGYSSGAYAYTMFSSLSSRAQNLRYIGNNAFNNCTKFSSSNTDGSACFVISENVEYIGDYAFANTKQKQLIFMSSDKVLEIGNYAFLNAFRAWRTGNIDSSYKHSYSNSAVTISIDTTHKFYPTAQLNLSPRTGNITIGKGAFLIQSFVANTGRNIYSTLFNSVTIPASVVSIGEGAFSIPGLTSISAVNNTKYTVVTNITDTLKTFELYETTASSKTLLFFLANDLPGSRDTMETFSQDITIANDTTRIGDYAFLALGANSYYTTLSGNYLSTNPSNLTGKLIIPASITSIGVSSFLFSYYGCRTIEFQTDTPPIFSTRTTQPTGTNQFTVGYYVSTPLTISVPASAKNGYVTVINAYTGADYTQYIIER